MDKKEQIDIIKKAMGKVARDISNHMRMSRKLSMEEMDYINFKVGALLGYAAVLDNLHEIYDGSLTCSECSMFKSEHLWCVEHQKTVHPHTKVCDIATL